MPTQPAPTQELTEDLQGHVGASRPKSLEEWVRLGTQVLAKRQGVGVRGQARSVASDKPTQELEPTEERAPTQQVEERPRKTPPVWEAPKASRWEVANTVRQPTPVVASGMEKQTAALSPAPSAPAAPTANDAATSGHSRAYHRQTPRIPLRSRAGAGAGDAPVAGESAANGPLEVAQTMPGAPETEVAASRPPPRADRPLRMGPPPRRSFTELVRLGLELRAHAQPHSTAHVADTPEEPAPPALGEAPHWREGGEQPMTPTQQLPQTAEDQTPHASEHSEGDEQSPAEVSEVQGHEAMVDSQQLAFDEAAAKVCDTQDARPPGASVEELPQVAREQVAIADEGRTPRAHDGATSHNFAQQEGGDAGRALLEGQARPVVTADRGEGDDADAPLREPQGARVTAGAPSQSCGEASLGKRRRLEGDEVTAQVTAQVTAGQSCGEAVRKRRRLSSKTRPGAEVPAAQSEGAAAGVPGQAREDELRRAEAPASLGDRRRPVQDARLAEDARPADDAREDEVRRAEVPASFSGPAEFARAALPVTPPASPGDRRRPVERARATPAAPPSAPRAPSPRGEPPSRLRRPAEDALAVAPSASPGGRERRAGDARAALPASPGDRERRLGRVEETLRDLVRSDAETRAQLAALSALHTTVAQDSVTIARERQQSLRAVFQHLSSLL